MLTFITNFTATGQQDVIDVIQERLLSDVRNLTIAKHCHNSSYPSFWSKFWRVICTNLA